jgi:hypothetical protein
VAWHWLELSKQPATIGPCLRAAPFLSRIPLQQAHAQRQLQLERKVRAHAPVRVCNDVDVRLSLYNRCVKSPRMLPRALSGCMARFVRRVNSRIMMHMCGGISTQISCVGCQRPANGLPVGSGVCVYSAGQAQEFGARGSPHPTLARAAPSPWVRCGQTASSDASDSWAHTASGANTAASTPAAAVLG